MPDLEESSHFDVEAQQSLLQTLTITHEPESSSRSRKTLQRAFLLIRSAKLFKLSGEKYSTRRSSSDLTISKPSSSCTSIAAADDEDNAGNMPDLEESNPFDVEAQQSLLQPLTITQELETSSRSRKTLRRTFLLVRSAKLFKLSGEKYSTYRSSFDSSISESSSSYTRIAAADGEDNAEMNLDEVGGAQGVAHALNIDLSNGLPSHPNSPNEERVLNLSLNFFHFFKKECNNYTIFLLLLAAVLSLIFGIKEEGLYTGWIDGTILIVAIFVLVTFIAIRSYLEASWYKKNQKQWSSVGDTNAGMIVTSVGRDENLIGSPETKCEFEVWLHKLRSIVQWIGLVLVNLILICLFIQYSLGKRDAEVGYRPDPKGDPTRLKIITDIVFKEIIMESKVTARVLIASLSVSLVGIMEGIPFVIAFAVSRWSRITLAENASEKDPLTVVKVAFVTAICTDKFGEVDKLFVDDYLVGEISVVSPIVLGALCDGIGIQLLSSSNDLKELVPISWAEEIFGLQKETLRNQCKILQHRESNLFQECSRALVLKTTENGQEWHFLHYKGHPQDILSLCSDYYNIEGEIKKIDDEKRIKFKEASDVMLAGQEEVIAYACKLIDGSNDMSVEANDLTFVGMVGLRNINQNHIRNAVSTLSEGGVRTILVSGDCIDALTTIGNNFGLLTPDSDALAVTGEEFKNFTEDERMQKLDRIRVMGSCSWQDKVLLVKCLREKGDIVAMLGQKTNDALALREADVGVAWGSWSSQMAREFSEIIIFKRDFTFLVDLINNGRCIYENIRKFIQFQLIITISNLSINFIATIVWGDAPISAFELFWLNLMVAVLGGLALLIDEWPKEILMKEPLKSSRQLVTRDMWRNITIQASYQTVICLTLHITGSAILGIGAGPIKSMIYNSLLLCQLFNIFIAREPEKKNIFKGLHQNRWLWVACVLFLLCQATIVAVENVVDESTRLNWVLWASCILIGLVSWPLDFAGKWIFLSVIGPNSKPKRNPEEAEVQSNSTSAHLDETAPSVTESLPKINQHTLLAVGRNKNTLLAIKTP